MRSAIVRWGLGVAVAGLLGGCTGSDNDPPSSTTAPESSASSVEEVPAGEIQQAPPLEDGWDGILDDVTIQSCPTEPGAVEATGTVVNSADGPRDITILISWNAPESTRSLMQLAVTEPGIPAGKTVKWRVSGDLLATAGQCVVLARSGRLAAG